MHPLGTQGRNALAQTILRNRDSIMQVYGASILHTVVDIQNDLRRHITDGRSNRRHCHGRKIAERGVAGEHENRPLLVGGSQAAEVNIAAVQSFGQAAASSQERDSSDCCGRAW